MSKKPTYFELLKDPRWQKKRLKIMERDNFECVECGDAESTLNVHHGAYLKGKKPWEYPDEMLRTLCESCHEANQEIMESVKEELGQLFFGNIEAILAILQISNEVEMSPQERLWHSLSSLCTLMGSCTSLDDLVMVVNHKIDFDNDDPQQPSMPF